MNKELLNAALADTAFVKRIAEAESAEAVQTLFAEKGLDLSLEDVKEIGKQIERLSQDADELNETDLENVAGGALAEAWLIAKAVIAIGGAGLAIYKWWRSTR